MTAYLAMPPDKLLSYSYFTVFTDMQFLLFSAANFSQPSLNQFTPTFRAIISQAARDKTKACMKCKCQKETLWYLPEALLRFYLNYLEPR
jgi:hypothetical protein